MPTPEKVLVSARPRQTWIDQARWAAIVLVVVGHFMGVLRGESGLALVVSNFVYMFHIPVFVLLAGWGASRASASGENLRKVFWQLLAPYLVFQLIAFGLNYVVEGSTPSWSFTSQTFGLWFLVALAGWRLIAPWFSGLRYPVPLATGIALLAGHSENIGGFLSLSRILYFLPMFLLGPWLVERLAVWRQQRRWRIGGTLTLLVAAVATAIFKENFLRRPFLGNSGYQAMELGPMEGMSWRLAALVIGTVLAAAFMLTLPGTPGAPSAAGRWVAGAGRSTMYPYLLHLPLLTLVGAVSLPEAVTPTWRAVLFMVIAVLFCALTVTRPVKALAQPFVEPRAFAARLSGQQSESSRT